MGEREVQSYDDDRGCPVHEKGLSCVKVCGEDVLWAIGVGEREKGEVIDRVVRDKVSDDTERKEGEEGEEREEGEGAEGAEGKASNAVGPHVKAVKLVVPDNRW